MVGTAIVLLAFFVALCIAFPGNEGADALDPRDELLLTGFAGR